MSGIPHFDLDPDEATNCLEICDDFFDFEREFTAKDSDGGSTPNHSTAQDVDGSDGSTSREHSPSTEQRSFPAVLHEIISNEDIDCIQWLPCGNFFIIRDKKAFSEQQILPRYLDARGTTKFTSFTRRLKRWKFQRVSSGSDIGAYYHDNFVRGRPDLAAKISYPSPSTSGRVLESNDKRRRRASTGCTEPCKGTEVGNILSLPLGNSVLSNARLELDQDMKEFLSSPGFIESVNQRDITPFESVSSLETNAMPQATETGFPTLPPLLSNFDTSPGRYRLNQFQESQPSNSVMSQVQNISNSRFNTMQVSPLAPPECFSHLPIFHTLTRRHSCLPLIHSKANHMLQMSSNFESHFVPLPMSSPAFVKMPFPRPLYEFNNHVSQSQCSTSNDLQDTVKLSDLNHATRC